MHHGEESDFQVARRAFAKSTGESAGKVVGNAIGGAVVAAPMLIPKLCRLAVRFPGPATVVASAVGVGATAVWNKWNATNKTAEPLLHRTLGAATSALDTRPPDGAAKSNGSLVVLLFYDDGLTEKEFEAIQKAVQAEFKDEHCVEVSALYDVAPSAAEETAPTDAETVRLYIRRRNDLIKIDIPKSEAHGIWVKCNGNGEVWKTTEETLPGHRDFSYCMLMAFTEDGSRVHRTFYTKNYEEGQITGFESYLDPLQRAVTIEYLLENKIDLDELSSQWKESDGQWVSSKGGKVREFVVPGVFHMSSEEAEICKGKDPIVTPCTTPTIPAPAIYGPAVGGEVAHTPPDAPNDPTEVFGQPGQFLQSEEDRKLVEEMLMYVVAHQAEENCLNDMVHKVDVHKNKAAKLLAPYARYTVDTLTKYLSTPEKFKAVVGRLVESAEQQSSSPVRPLNLFSSASRKEVRAEEKLQ